jgi:hypothetical protein
VNNAQSAASNSASLSADLFGGSSAAPPADAPAAPEEPKKNTKESILALYGSSSSNQQMFGVPGRPLLPCCASFTVRVLQEACT